MSNNKRETPPVPPFDIPCCDPAFPDVGSAPEDSPRFEEVLNVAQIQGNSIAGFNKDFQWLLFLTIDDAPKFKQALGKLLKDKDGKLLRGNDQVISTADQVIKFNRLFKFIHKQVGDPTGLVATW